MSEATFSNPEVPPQTSPPPTGHRIFQSQSLVFILLRIGMYVALSTGISFAVLWVAAALMSGVRSSYSPRIMTISETGLLAGALAAGLVMSQLEGRPFGEYGLPARGAFGKLFWQGALFGLLEISAVIGFIAALGSYHFGSLAIHGVDLLRWAAFWFALFVMVGLYEEFAFRGYVQFTLTQATGFWPAALLLSIAFGYVHRTNPGESKLGLAGVMLAGLFWCFTLRRTGNLWFAVGMHASFDFGETFLYSVPDSGMVFQGHLSNATLAGPGWLTGGSTGPEASVCDFVMLLVLFYVFHRLYPVRAQSSLRHPSP
jgi:membrane protease YdiL (CAAX protease family)